jgi:hypothetical protein
MTLKTRRFLYILFVLIFITVTPLISLYAAGYKIGNGFSIQKTGILILDSEPSGAKIFIDNKIQQKFLNKLLKKEEGFIETPAKIKNLKPGDYKIRISLDGYWPWEKKLTVNPGQSTFAEDIFLFKKDLPLMMLHGKLNDISLSPNQKFLVVNQDETTSLINLENDLIETVSTSSSINITNCVWSPKSKTVLIDNQLCNTSDTKEKKSILNLIGKEAKNIKWDTKNENKLYCVYDDTISCFDLSSNQNNIILKNKHVTDYFPRDNYLFYVEKIDNQSKFYVHDINKNELVKTIGIPNSDYIFWNTEHDLINLYDSKYHILYLINPFSPVKPLHDTISNVKETFWVNNDILLYANDFEIWTYDQRNQSKKLITRISDKIDSIFWNHEKNFIIYSTDKNINVIDLDERENYSSTKLFEIDTISNLQINKSGDTLYFYSKIGNQEGLYKLNIK